VRDDDDDDDDEDDDDDDHGSRSRGDGEDKSRQNLERGIVPPDFVMLQNFKHQITCITV